MYNFEKLAVKAGLPRVTARQFITDGVTEGSIVEEAGLGKKGGGGMAYHLSDWVDSSTEDLPF